MLEMKIKIEADAAVLKAIDKLTTALEKNAVNISVSQDAPAPGEENQREGSGPVYGQI